MCETMSSKYSNLCNMATDALDGLRWDTREELMRIVETSNIKHLEQLENQKKLNTKNLNQRSSDSLLNQYSSRNLLSP